MEITMGRKKLPEKDLLRENRVVTYLPREVMDRVIDLAERENRTTANYVRGVLERHVNDPALTRKKTKPR